MPDFKRLGKWGDRRDLNPQPPEPQFHVPPFLRACSLPRPRMNPGVYCTSIPLHFTVVRTWWRSNCGQDCQQCSAWLADRSESRASQGSDSYPIVAHVTYASEQAFRHGEQMCKASVKEITSWPTNTNNNPAIVALLGGLLGGLPSSGWTLTDHRHGYASRCAPMKSAYSERKPVRRQAKPIQISSSCQDWRGQSSNSLAVLLHRGSVRNSAANVAVAVVLACMRSRFLRLAKRGRRGRLHGDAGQQYQQRRFFMPKSGTKLLHTDAPVILAFDPAGAAAALHVSRTRLYDLLRTHAIASYHVGKSRRISLRALQDYQARCEAAERGGTVEEEGGKSA